MARELELVVIRSCDGSLCVSFGFSGMYCVTVSLEDSDSVL